MAQLFFEGIQSLEEARNLAAINSRGAFGPVPFAKYFGVNPDELTGIGQEALRASLPSEIKEQLYRKSAQSMLSPDRNIGWVVLSSAEYTTVVEYPEKLAERVSAKNDTQLPALFRDDRDRLAANRRAGAHVLEGKLPKMERLMGGYVHDMELLRGLLPMIDYHWHARQKGIDVRIAALTARDGLRAAIKTIADIKGWNDTDRSQALLGLDVHLLGGKGKQRLDEKKQAWKDGINVIGNYDRNKHILVRDRALRSKFEIAKRLK